MTSRATRLASYAYLADYLAMGLWLPASALYLTRWVGLSSGQVALGGAIAGVIGVAAGSITGRLADRHGVRRVGVAAYLAQGMAMLCMALVTGFGTLLIVWTMMFCGMFAVRAVRVAILARVGGSERVCLRARVQG